MKQKQITIPVSLPCATCGAEMTPFEDTRLFVCSVWPVHKRFLTWRDLEVGAAEDSFEFLWQGQLIGSISRDRLRAEFRVLRFTPPGQDEEPELTPEFSSRDGLGLFVRKGSAYFRNVVLEPQG